MPWLIEPAYLGKKMTLRTQGEIDAMVSGGTARKVFASWYIGTGTVAPDLKPINITQPMIVGYPYVGTVLTVDEGTWQNAPTGYTYKWYAAGILIAGATAKTYTPVAGDLDKQLVCDVIAANVEGSATARSMATAAVRNPTAGDGSGSETGEGEGGTPAPPPVPTIVLPPVINGVGKVGERITVSQGTWTNTPTSFTYRWAVGGNIVEGATENGYTPVEADVGEPLAAEVTAINAYGSTAHAVGSYLPVAPADAPAATGTDDGPAVQPVPDDHDTKVKVETKPAPSPVAPAPKTPAKPTTTKK